MVNLFLLKEFVMDLPSNKEGNPPARQCIGLNGKPLVARKRSVKVAVEPINKRTEEKNERIRKWVREVNASLGIGPSEEETDQTVEAEEVIEACPNCNKRSIGINTDPPPSSRTVSILTNLKKQENK